MSESTDAPIRRFFHPARSLEPSDPLVAAIVSRAAASPRQARPSLSLRRTLAPALATLIVLIASAYAVPVTRAALQAAADEIAAAFRGWTRGDPGAAPGRALRAGEPAPSYFYDGAWARSHVGEPRVLAEAGDYKLYAYRHGGGINFDLGDTGIAMGGFTPGDFNDRPLYVLGYGSMRRPDENGHVPWFGLTARLVATVELTYASGPPLRLDARDGAFVLLSRVARGPRQIIARDADGDVVDRQPIRFAASLEAISAAAAARPASASP